MRSTSSVQVPLRFLGEETRYECGSIKSDRQFRLERNHNRVHVLL